MYLHELSFKPNNNHCVVCVSLSCINLNVRHKYILFFRKIFMFQFGHVSWLNLLSWKISCHDRISVMIDFVMIIFLSWWFFLSWFFFCHDLSGPFCPDNLPWMVPARWCISVPLVLNKYSLDDYANHLGCWVSSFWNNIFTTLDKSPMDPP